MAEVTEYTAPIKFGPLNYIVYFIAWSISWPLVHILWRTKVNGIEKLRSIRGPVIVAPTHRSAVDPIIVGLLTNRPTRPLAKAELTQYKFAWLFKKMGIQPVRRGEADREALRVANLWLQNDQLVLLFPEGTRKDGEAVLDLHDGVGYLAAKNNVPVIPIGVGGSELAMPKGAKFIHRASVKVEIGDPIIPNPELKLRESTKDIMDKLAKELQIQYDKARNA